MKITKKLIILPIIISIVLIVVGFGIQEVDRMNETKTYSNKLYTFRYPSNWESPEVIIDKEMGHHLLQFPKGDNSISLKVIASRIYPFDSSQKNYIDKRLDEIQENLIVEAFVIDETPGYRYIAEENGTTNTQYLVQKKDMIYQMHFECRSNDYNNFKPLMNQITKTFKINAIGSLSELDNWNKYSIEHLEIYYPDNSKIYDNIEEWAKIRVEAFDYIVDYLDIEWTYEQIKIFVFDSNKHGEKYGIRLGFAISEYGEIYTKYNQSPGHELAHCISYRINDQGKMNSDLINEGLATYLNMTGRDYHRLASKELKDNNYNIKILGDDFRKNKEAYTLGASFVQYLIDAYGLELFKDFFAQDTNNKEENFEEFYKKQGITLVNEWIQFIKTY